jgi:hypothetical protein
MTQSILETVEMKLLRKVTNKIPKYRATSEDVRKTCKVDYINKWVRERKKMTDNRVVKVARDKSPNKRRSTGRPRKRRCGDI